MIKVVPVPEKNMYELCETIVLKGVMVPEGFQWNGASIPPRFWDNLALTPFHPKVMRASLLHDYLYTMKEGLREHADSLFEELLLEDGVEKYKVNLMHFAVRNWGHTTWMDESDKELWAAGLDDLNDGAA